MKVIPLLPLSPKNPMPRMGFESMQDFARAIPGEWEPEVSLLRPGSFPTAFYQAKATEFVLCKQVEAPANRLSPKAEPLLRGSKLLLRALLTGQLRIDWVRIDQSRDASPTERLLFASLPYIQSDAFKRLGLLRGADNKLLGYIGEEAVPVVSAKLNARQIAELDGLARAEDVTRAASIMIPLRERMRNNGSWVPTRYPWMAAIELLLRDSGFVGASSSEPARPVAKLGFNVHRDVRAHGPFFPPGWSHGDDNGQAFYWPAYSPAYVTNLAAALLQTSRRKDNELVFEAANVVQASLRVEQDLLGGGCAYGVESSKQPTPPKAVLAALESNELASAKSHVQNLYRSVPTLVQAVQDEPWLLTDVARVVALFAPRLVGARAAANLTPAVQASLEKAGMPSALPPAQIDALIQRGDAAMLSDPDQTTIYLWLERVEVSGRVLEPQELSRIGAALWLVFGGPVPAGRELARDNKGNWYLRRSEGDLFYSTAEAPLLTDEAVTQLLPDSPAAEQSGERTATLARFWKAYSVESEPGTPRALARVAVQTYVRRLIGPVQAQMLDAARFARTDSPEKLPAGQVEIGIADGVRLGTLELWRDSFQPWAG